MFLFNIGGTKNTDDWIPVTDFCYFLPAEERFIWEQKDISTLYLCFSALTIAVCTVDFHKAVRQLGSPPANT